MLPPIVKMTFASAATVLLCTTWAITPAQAYERIYIKNDTGKKNIFCTYSPSDKTQLIALESKKIKKGKCKKLKCFNSCNVSADCGKKYFKVYHDTHIRFTSKKRYVTTPGHGSCSDP